MEIDGTKRDLENGNDPWQPIETAPKDGTNIDVWFFLNANHGSGARWANVRWSEPRETWIGGPPSQDSNGWEPTHWMPHPAPPHSSERVG